MMLRGINKIMSRFVGVVEVVSLRIQSLTATLRIWLNMNLPHVFWGLGVGSRGRDRRREEVSR